MQIVDQESPALFQYSDVKPQLTAILQEWESREEIRARKRRELRRDDVNVEEMRRKGELEAHESYIPQRVIDRRIKDEVPSQLNFLQTPERLLIFTDPANPDKSTENLERAFTVHMRYRGWLLPWIKAFDSCDLHGGSALEVRFDPTKPFSCAIDYIRREDLIFPVEADSLQSCEYIMRRYKYMPFELESFIQTYGFDQTAVHKLTDAAKTGSKRHERISIYKVYRKFNGVVYVFWYSDRCDNYLKQPTPLELGLYSPKEAISWQGASAAYSQQNMNPMALPPELPAQLPITDYPVFWLPYEIVEDDLLLSSRGRAFRDAADQEVQTELWSAIVNASTLAAGIYGTRVNSMTGEVGLSETDSIKPNTIIQKETKFWNFPFPSGEILAVATQYGVNSAATNGRVDYAVNNRQDSRKTAREINASQAQQAEITSAAIACQSQTFLDVYALCWEIGRSQVLIGAITSFNIPIEDLLPTYRLATAGDTDILTREAKKQVIRETFQYVAGTPIANLFLSYLVETYFPEKSKDWVPALMSGDPVDLISQASTLLQASMTPTVLSNQDKLQLQQFIQMLNTYVQSRTGGNVPTGAQSMGEPPNNQVANNLPAEQAGAASGASY